MNRAERRRQEKLIKKQKEDRTEETTDQKAINWFQKALICQQNSQWDEAIQLYRKARSANSKFIQAYPNLWNLLRIIDKNPNLSQRELANNVNFSLGKYILILKINSLYVV